jgi:hypothetical protein
MLTKKQKLQGKFRYEDTCRRLIEENGVVSIWLGTADSEKDIIHYLEEDYSEFESDFTGYNEYENPNDFDFVKNLFGLDFGFGSYDHDFFEYSFFEPTNDVVLILSQINDFLPSLKQRMIDQHGKTLNKTYNTSFFLISYRYVPKYVPKADYTETDCQNKKILMEFLATFKFDEEISLIHR